MAWYSLRGLSISFTLKTLIIKLKLLIETSLDILAVTETKLANDTTDEDIEIGTFNRPFYSSRRHIGFVTAHTR